MSGKTRLELTRSMCDVAIDYLAQDATQQAQWSREVETAKDKLVVAWRMVRRWLEARAELGKRWLLLLDGVDNPAPVSYTHLTLPTNREV